MAETKGANKRLTKMSSKIFELNVINFSFQGGISNPDCCESLPLSRILECSTLTPEIVSKVEVCLVLTPFIWPDRRRCGSCWSCRAR